MGLDEFPRLRAEGRLGSYRGTPPLSEAGIHVVASLVRQAALNIEALEDGWRGREFSIVEKARRIVLLTRLGLEGLATAVAFSEEGLQTPSAAC
jgi:hypothetical protein